MLIFDGWLVGLSGRCELITASCSNEGKKPAGIPLALQWVPCT